MNIKTFVKFTLIIVVSFNFANAQKLEATHKKWNLYSMQKQGNKICFIASTPIKESGTYTKRGQPYILVANRKGKQDEVNVSSGYPYKKGKDLKAVFDDNDKYYLFAEGEHAWAKNSKADKSLISDMRAGNRITINGTSWKGTTSKDTYSLAGFTAAYKHMNKMCK